GPEAAVNAVYYNKIQELPESERAAYVSSLQEEYREDIDIFRLASELIVDAIVPANELRDELIRRFAVYERRQRSTPARHHAVPPV
ncbi:MAG TPA: carboxyl transferase domain-containing protein, partial [Candidatus Acidoferrales bacterium]|nr:carboxyl transferase domain-containing protein [Candidatus Acidoferrales bacterium]